jgi:hypothetical protein
MRAVSLPPKASLTERDATSTTASACAAIRSPVSMAHTSACLFGSHMMWRFFTPVDSTMRLANGTSGLRCLKKISQDSSCVIS